MAFPATLTAYPTVVDGVTTLGSAQHGPYKAGLEEMEKLLVGPLWRNAIAYGADPSGTADSSAAIASAITALGSTGGIVYVAPGRYRMDTLVQVPSRVGILGAGKYTTRFYQPSGRTADQYMFEAVSGGVTNMFSQSYGHLFAGFTIEDRNTADTALTTTGRAEDRHGILISDSDWGIVRDVMIRDLAGIALHCEDVVREWHFANLSVYNCGDGPENLAAVEIASATGDATNTMYFHHSRFYFNVGLALRVTGSQDGIRLIFFTDCQFEGGGNGSGGTFGNAHDYDLVRLGLMQTATFSNCNFSNPGAGEHCLDLEGSATSPIDRVNLSNCFFNGNSVGGGVRANRVNMVAVTSCLFVASTVADADFYVETNAGVIYVSLDTENSPNATAGSPAGHFRGREDAKHIDFRDQVLSLNGGGWTSYVAGAPATNLNLGFAAPIGMEVYDITNHIWWSRHTVSGIGDRWIPRPGSVLTRRGSEDFTTTLENDLLNYTIPDGVMHEHGGLECEVWGQFQGSGTGTPTFRIRLNGTVVYQDALLATTSGVQAWHVRFVLKNVGATNVNRLGGVVIINTTAAAATGVGDIAADEIAGHGAIQANTSVQFAGADIPIRVTIQHSTGKETNVRGGYIRSIN